VKILPAAAGVLLLTVLPAGWAMNESCSTYRGTFRPADLVCDLPNGRELEITVAHPPPVPATAAGEPGQTAKRPICVTTSKTSWELVCALPFGRELNVNLAPERQPRARCKLLIDCPAHY
jgi:hypothetical protein